MINDAWASDVSMPTARHGLAPVRQLQTIIIRRIIIAVTALPSM